MEHKKEHIDDFSAKAAAAPKAGRKRKNAAPKKHAAAASAAAVGTAPRAVSRTSSLNDHSDVDSCASSSRRGERDDAATSRRDVVMTPDRSTPPVESPLSGDGGGGDTAAASHNTADVTAPEHAPPPPLRTPSPPSPPPPPTSTISEETQRILDQYSDEQILEELVARREVFVCVCGTVFREQALYFLHRGVHNTNNPKKCATCDYTARDWYDFTSHLFVHNNISDSKNAPSVT